MREWLKFLSADDRQTIGIDIKTVEYGWPIGMPASRPLGSKLYEVRSNISDKRIARVIFTIIDHYMVLLSGFVKKTQQTLKEEIALALKRMNTSRSAINRLLDPLNTSITLATVESAVTAMGKRLQIQIV